METKDPSAFSVDFRKAGKPDSAVARLQTYGLCPVTFRIARGKQKIDFTVYVDEEAHAQEDFIKVARHQLHHDLARLAEQTKVWNLPDVQIPKRTMLDDGDDLPF